VLRLGREFRQSERDAPDSAGDGRKSSMIARNVALLKSRRSDHIIANDQELNVTLDRIAKFQRQVSHLRNVKTNPEDYHGSVSGSLAEIDRMQLEVREYLSTHPAELAKSDA